MLRTLKEEIANAHRLFVRGLMDAERRHKNIVHGGCLLMITWSLAVEGGKPADWAFLLLAVACEAG